MGPPAFQDNPHRAAVEAWGNISQLGLGRSGPVFVLCFSLRNCDRGAAWSLWRHAGACWSVETVTEIVTFTDIFDI